jgi:hypothetical protein
MERMMSYDSLKSFITSLRTADHPKIVQITEGLLTAVRNGDASAMHSIVSACDGVTLGSHTDLLNLLRALQPLPWQAWRDMEAILLEPSPESPNTNPDDEDWYQTKLKSRRLIAHLFLATWNLTPQWAADAVQVAILAGKLEVTVSRIRTVSVGTDPRGTPVVSIHMDCGAIKNVFQR